MGEGYRKFQKPIPRGTEIITTGGQFVVGYAFKREVSMLNSESQAVCGRVVELADTLDSKSSASNSVRVQLPPRPYKRFKVVGYGAMENLSFV